MKKKLGGMILVVCLAAIVGTAIWGFVQARGEAQPDDDDKPAQTASHVSVVDGISTITLNELTGVRGEASLRPMLRRMTAADYPEAPEAMIDLLATRTHFVDKRGRLQPLFDPALIRLLEPFSLDDVLTAQWPLFDALATAPLLMMRTQMTQQLRRDTFEEMMRRRRDAEAFVIESQGSPALLDTLDDVQPIADFVREATGLKRA